jgi:hypothetical protein
MFIINFNLPIMERLKVPEILDFENGMSEQAQLMSYTLTKPNNVTRKPSDWPIMIILFICGIVTIARACGLSWLVLHLLSIV